MEFRPCIDIHNGKVKQIVGASLKDQGNRATENFVASFDADYYAQQNPDVVAALGADPGMLYQHYVVAGKTEGRLPCAPTGAAMAAIPADFDAAFYAAAYPDVAAALGSDPWTLYQHYVNYGRIEGRLGNAGGMVQAQVEPVVNYTGMG